jgi:transposase-like protein
MQCPTCHSLRTIKNGSIPSGKPKWMCKDCRRQFVVNPKRHRIPTETIDLVDRLLLEKLSLAGIARAAGVSARWLQYYVNKKYAAVPHTVAVHPKKSPPDPRM